MHYERKKKKRKLNPPYYDRSFGGGHQWSPDLYSHIGYTLYEPPCDSGYDEPPTSAPPHRKMKCFSGFCSAGASPHFEPQPQIDTQIASAPIASTSRLETVLYDDVFHYVFSFLSIESLSSSMQVNQTFAKTAKKARENTKVARVSPTASSEYVHAVLENCKQITCVALDRGATLPEKQLEAIIRFYADTVVSVDVFHSPIVCSMSTHCGQAVRPISCSHYFLSFMAKTVKNLEYVNCCGCIREADFLEFASTTRSLKFASFGLAKHRFHEELDMDKILLGLKLLLHNNQSLTHLRLYGFVGFENILLNADCPLLKYVCLSSYHPQMLKKLIDKFPHLVLHGRAR